MKYILLMPLLAMTFIFFMANSSGIIYAQAEEEVYDKVEVMPEYPGGQNEIFKFISQNLEYPETSRKNGIEGTVYVGFIVDKTGKVTKVKKIKGDIHTNNKEIVTVKDKEGKTVEIVEKAKEELVEEAIHVVSMLSDFKPGEQNGKKVNVSYVFPIKFSLGK